MILLLLPFPFQYTILELSDHPTISQIFRNWPVFRVISENYARMNDEPMLCDVSPKMNYCQTYSYVAQFRLPKTTIGDVYTTLLLYIK